MHPQGILSRDGFTHCPKPEAGCIGFYVTDTISRAQGNLDSVHSQYKPSFKSCNISVFNILINVIELQDRPMAISELRTFCSNL